MHLSSYLEQCAAFGWSGGPVFNTRIAALKSGAESRNADWIDVRHKFTAPYTSRGKDVYLALKRQFLVCRGMLGAFRFRDELDYQATDEIFGAGDGVEDTFQLKKISEADGVQYERLIHALAVAPTVPFTVTVDGVATTAFSVNIRTGQLRFDSPPADGAVLRWSGEFDIWVRFASDDLDFSLDNPNSTNGRVSLIEVAAPVEAIP